MKNNTLIFFFLFTAAFAVNTRADNMIRYVSLTASSTHPYTNWTMAATNLADAAADAPSGCTLIVDRGRYYATASITRPGYLHSLTVTSLYGSAETIYDGGGQAMDGFKFQGSLSVYGMTFTGFDSPDTDLAAIYVDHQTSVLVLNDCVFIENRGLEAGAVRMRFGTLEATNVLFQGNIATTTGNYGAGALQGPSLVLDDCEFIDNALTSGTQGGGAIMNSGGISVIRNSCFSGNTASGNSAGALYIHTHSNVRMENSVFFSNTNSAVRLRAAAGPGQIINAHVRNCLFKDNDGWAIDAGHRYNFLVVENNTIVNNTGGITANSGADDGTITNINSIVYFNNNNHSVSTNFFWLNSFTTPAPTFNFVDSKTEDPLFADPDAGDFRLGRRSPCINAGLYQTWMDTAFDLDGNPRILDGTVDIGAFEHVPPPFGTIFRLR